MVLREAQFKCILCLRNKTDLRQNARGFFFDSVITRTSWRRMCKNEVFAFDGSMSDYDRLYMHCSKRSAIRDGVPS